MTGSCLLSLGAGASAGWRSGAFAPMTAAIVIDEQGGGGGAVGAGNATLLGGRMVPNVMRVEIALSDGSTVTASIGNGHWLAWWPAGLLADRISATGANGEVAVIEWQNGGWSTP